MHTLDWTVMQENPMSRSLLNPPIARATKASHSPPLHAPPDLPGPEPPTFGRVVDAEVGGPVDDDALHGDAKALVQALDAVRLGDLPQAVGQAGELPGGARLAHVGRQAGTGEVQRVDEAEGGGPRRAAGRQVPGEVAPELGVLVHAAQEDLLVFVLEGKVEGLGGEVADDVGQVAAPEGEEALLFGDAYDAVHDALVLHVGADLLADMLDLTREKHKWVSAKEKKMTTFSHD